MPVEVAPVKQQMVAESSEFLGTLISRQSVDIQSKVQGIIQSIHVTPGQQVAKGQMLVVIRDQEVKAALNSSQAQSQATRESIDQAQKTLESLRAERQALQSTLVFNQTQLQRYQTLFAQQSASKEEVDRIQDTVRRAQADLANSAARIRAQQEAVQASRKNYQASVANVAEQRAILGEYQIRAPFSGFVGDIPFKVGNFIQPLDKIMSLTRNNTLELNVELPAEDAMKVRQGTRIDLLGLEGQPVASTRVNFIAPRVAPETQTVLVKGQLQNNTGILRADQTIRTRVIWREVPGFLVPTSSVLHLGGRDFVYIADKNPQVPDKLFAKQIPVVLGEIEGTNYVVRSGLKDGMTLITGGVQKLQDGVPVMTGPPPGVKPGAQAPGAGPKGH
jgi:RND family efflux transporter MFP subunit